MNQSQFAPWHGPTILTVRKGGWETWKDDVVEALRSINLIEEK